MSFWKRDDQPEEITYIDLAEFNAQKGAATTKTHAERMEHLEELRLIKEIQKLDSESKKEPAWISVLKSIGEVGLKLGGAALIAWGGLNLERHGSLLPKGTDPNSTLRTIKQL